MKVVKTTAAPQAIGPYSQAVVSGGHVYTSGQIPLTADGELIQGDVTAQTEQVLSNVRAVLEAAGTDMNHVVKVTIFLSDMNHFQQVNEVYAAHFDRHQPARSCVEVSRLPKDVQIEVEAIAVIPTL
ncbi:RidA family protein [Mechercharimyces sp. CAU 1602]|nr:RidA family protein [Mechercharimyces sp. CAU 1602]